MIVDFGFWENAISSMAFGFADVLQSRLGGLGDAEVFLGELL
jgi:hypothetical protein